jgi:hypothetical protein
MSRKLNLMLGIIVLLVVIIGLLVWGVRRIEPRLAFFPLPGEDRTPAELGARFESFTVETADGERLRAWHLPQTNATAQVVYFHGNGGNLAMWSDILVALAREGFDVIAVDYRGYGESSGSPSEQGLYRDAEATVDEVHRRLRRAELPLIYWGRSIGTAVAARAAAYRAPDGVVLEAGFPTARSILRSNPVMLLLSLVATYRFATAEWMAAVSVPTLVLHGDRDSVIPYRLGQQLYEALPGPKRFVTIAGGDHNDPVPANAAAYWTAVRDFVKSLSATRR